MLIPVFDSLTKDKAIYKYDFLKIFFSQCYVRSNTIDGKTITSYGCEKVIRSRHIPIHFFSYKTQTDVLIFIINLMFFSTLLYY